MLLRKLNGFLKDECGASMVEYAVALIVVTAAGAGVMGAIGTDVSESVTDACQAIDTEGDC